MGPGDAVEEEQAGGFGREAIILDGGKSERQPFPIRERIHIMSLPGPGYVNSRRTGLNIHPKARGGH